MTGFTSFVIKSCQLKKTANVKRNYHLMIMCVFLALSKEYSCSGVKKEADPDFAPPYMLQHRQVKRFGNVQSIIDALISQTKTIMMINVFSSRKRFLQLLENPY